MKWEELVKDFRNILEIFALAFLWWTIWREARKGAPLTGKAFDILATSCVWALILLAMAAVALLAMGLRSFTGIW